MEEFWNENNVKGVKDDITTFRELVEFWATNNFDGWTFNRILRRVLQLDGEAAIFALLWIKQAHPLMFKKCAIKSAVWCKIAQKFSKYVMD